MGMGMGMGPRPGRGGRGMGFDFPGPPNGMMMVSSAARLLVRGPAALPALLCPWVSGGGRRLGHPNTCCHAPPAVLPTMLWEERRWPGVAPLQLLCVLSRHCAMQGRDMDLILCPSCAVQCSPFP